MSEIVVDRVIAASPERVWAVLTDLDRAAETLSGVTSVQGMTDGPYAVGTRWRETRTMFGRSATQEMWVSECDPLRSTEVRAEFRGALYATQFTLTPLLDGARPELSDPSDTDPSDASGTDPSDASGASGTDPSDDSATELSIRFKTEAHSRTTAQHIGLKFFGAIAGRAARKTLERDLADIAAAAEAARP